MSEFLTSSPQVAIRHSQTAADVDAVLRCRHQVYSEEHRYFEQAADGRIFDRFDTYPDTTLQLIAEVDGEIVAGVRFCLHDSAVGLPVDGFYDFGPHLRPNDRVACGGMMFVARSAAGAGIATRLILGGETWAAQHTVSIILGTINPAIRKVFDRLRYTAVGAPREHAGLPFVPMTKRLAADPTVMCDG